VYSKTKKDVVNSKQNKMLCIRCCLLDVVHSLYNNSSSMLRSMLLLLLALILPYIFFCGITASSHCDTRSDDEKKMGARALARHCCAPLLEGVLRVCPSVPLLLLLLCLFSSG